LIIFCSISIYNLPLDKCASSDVAIIDEVNSMLDKIIQEKKDVIRSESEHIQSLQHKQIQENGDIEPEKHKSQPQNMKRNRSVALLQSRSDGYSSTGPGLSFHVYSIND